MKAITVKTDVGTITWTPDESLVNLAGRNYNDRNVVGERAFDLIREAAFVEMEQVAKALLAPLIAKTLEVERQIKDQVTQAHANAAAIERARRVGMAS